MEAFTEFYKIILRVHIDKLTKEKREYIMYAFKVQVQDICVSTLSFTERFNRNIKNCH